jgi:hypothetical protein
MELHLARAHFLSLLVAVKKLLQSPQDAEALATLIRHWPAYDRLLPAEAMASAVELVQRSEQTFADAQALVQLMLRRAGPAVTRTAPGSSSAPR